jgi:ribosome-binding ATPase
MRLGIIGLPQSGKTTIFNALTRGDKPVGSPRMAGGGRFEVQTGAVPVPDERIGKLSAMYKPRKTIYAQVVYADINGVEGAGEGEKAAFSGPLLNQLAGLDGFLHVVRAFENPSVPHPSGQAVDPRRDLATVDGELLLNDMLAVERKLERLKEEAHKGIIKDKGLHAQESAIFERLQEALAEERLLRDVDLNAAEEKLLSSYQLLTRKPTLVVFNTGDDSAAIPAGVDYSHKHSAVAALQGKLEMEIAQLPPDEAAMFLQEYGIAEPGLSRIIRMSYDLVGLLSFFTVGEDEVRAWTVRRGAAAPEAAGQIHTDMLNGFIRAEVVHYDDLVALGSHAEARSHGKVRLEGKEYTVKDGDILNIRFSPPAK